MSDVQCIEIRRDETRCDHAWPYLAEHEGDAGRRDRLGEAVREARGHLRAGHPDQALAMVLDALAVYCGEVGE